MSRAVATVLMPLAALKQSSHGLSATNFLSCNSPNAACGIETPDILHQAGGILPRCNSPNAACGIETALSFRFLHASIAVATVLMPLAALKRSNNCHLVFLLFVATVLMPLAALSLPCLFGRAYFFCQQCRILCLNAVLFYGGILNVILQKKIGLLHVI